MTRTEQTARPARKCTACNRAAGTGREVEGLGWYGPCCYRKVAALQAVLEREGLTGLLTERLEFELVEATDAHGYPRLDYPVEVYELKCKAERIGLVFHAWRLDVFRLEAEARARLPHNKDARKRLFGGLEALKAAA